MHDNNVQNAYNAYFRFNNQRTLSTELPSELSMTDADGCSIFVDKTRRYDNQMIIRDVCKTEQLAKHLQRFSDDISPEISIAPQANTEQLQSWLSNQGFAPLYQLEFLELLAADYVATKQGPESIAIERWRHDHADAFLALLKTSGVECNDKIWDKKRAFYCTDTFRCFVAKMKGKPCAWATTFIDDKQAILGNAYTQESYRSQGCQTALLRARIEDAIALGCERLLTDVIPGSTSRNNCTGVGFSSTEIRTVWGND